jgi:hypothetical protein
MPPERCGLRLIDTIRANTPEQEASARADVWRRYKVQLAHVACGWEPGHKGKCMWRWAMTWWRPGVDSETPDPETDALIGAELRRRTGIRRRAQGVLGLVGALAARLPRGGKS